MNRMEIIFCGFKEVNIELTRKPFEELINQLAQGLELKSLKYIIIPENFKSELIEFQRSKGLREDGGTENEVGVAGGKVMSYFEEGELVACIFLHSAILGLLFSENSDDVLDSIQTLNHELCHVQDNHFKSKIFDLEFTARTEKDFDRVLKIHADSIWSEFIANKLSKRLVNINGVEINLPAQKSLEQTLGLLMESIFKVEADAQNYIDAYRSHANIERLYGEIQESAGFLLTMMGRSYGFLYHNDELIELMDEYIRRTWTSEIWSLLCQSLDELNAGYPNWEGVDVFNDLSQVVLKTWNTLGIYPQITDDGLYIHVPFK